MYGKINECRTEEAKEQNTSQLSNKEKDALVVRGFIFVNKRIVEEDITFFKGVVQINHTQSLKQINEIVQRYVIYVFIGGKGNGDRDSVIEVKIIVTARKE